MAGSGRKEQGSSFASMNPNGQVGEEVVKSIKNTTTRKVMHSAKEQGGLIMDDIEGHWLKEG